MSFPARSLAADEQAVLHFLLEVDVPGAAELREQAVGARVVAACECGCPTVDLQVPVFAPEAPLPDGPYSIEAEVGSDREQPGGGIMLFIKGGRLARLEYYFYDSVPGAWPPLADLRLEGGNA
jgi:hypothetical protein